jgi:hypothetical protein
LSFTSWLLRSRKRAYSGRQGSEMSRGERRLLWESRRFRIVTMEARRRVSRPGLTRSSQHSWIR